MSLSQNKLVRWIGWKFLLRNPRWRLRLTRLFIKEEDRDVEIFGGRLRVNTIKEIGYVSASTSCRSNVVTRDEAGSLLNLALILEPSDTFVDIGANVGLYSVLLGRLQSIFPGLRYHAFEANPDTFSRLRYSLEGMNTEAHCIAISSEVGPLEFCPGATSGVFGAASSASDFQMKNERVRVEAKRLDTCNILGDSLVLKIDVEGHEWEVLAGAQALLRANRVKAIYLDGYKDARIPDLLTRHGFKAYDGRTLVSPPTQEFSVLWLHQRWLLAGSRARAAAV